jgi:hypothetical protein
LRAVGEAERFRNPGPKRPGAAVNTDDVVWHLSTSPPGASILGQPARLILDRERRLALTRYHTVLHVLNTITLRDYGGWITGVQIGTEYSRIDFTLNAFSAALRGELEAKECPGAPRGPGQCSGGVAVTGGQAIPADEIKNGTTPFNVTTEPPTSPIPGAPLPNTSWTENITDMAFTSAVITVGQPPGTTVLTVSCAISPPTSDGAVPSQTVTCVAT